MQSNKSIALFGDVVCPTDQIALKRGGDGKGKLSYSKKEIDEIESLLRNKYKTKRFDDSLCTTERFLSLDNNSTGIIHFSTHGKQQRINPEWSKYASFIKEKDDNILVEELDWLLNSTGLEMSSSVQGGTTTEILKSYQISRCNLAACDLAVMSACNTSYGTSSEAYVEPMGLNYAFQMASVRNIISTLRDVYDQDAAEFMEMFYRHCVETENYYIAFKNAVADAFNKDEDDTDYWSSFIFIINN